MFTLLDAKKYFFPNRSGTTQEGSQGLWDYPQPIPDGSRYPKQHQKYIFFFRVRNLKSLLPGQGEFEFRSPEVQNGYKIVKI